jgi:hypothetical protein
MGIRGSAPGERRGGRQKGTPNKVNSDLKEMILGALAGVGGQDYLQRQAELNPGSFLTLIGKVLPLQLTGENGKPIAYRFRWDDAALPETSNAETDIAVQWIEADPAE